MTDMRDSIKALLEATHPKQNRDPEVRSASWRRLSLLPVQARWTMTEIIEEVLEHEIHPLPLTSVRDYLTMPGTDIGEREVACQTLSQKLCQRLLPPPIQKILLDTLLPVSRTLSPATHRQRILSLIHAPSIIHPELCIQLGEELLSQMEIHPGRGQYRTNDPRLAVAFKDLSGKLGEHHPRYPYFQSQSLYLSSGRKHDMLFSLHLERYLLSRRPHFRGHLLQSLIGLSAVQENDKEGHEKSLIPDQPSRKDMLDELSRELRGTRHESVRAAGYELLAEADQYRSAPRFPSILTELIRSGPEAWKGFRLELEEYITQTPWYDPDGWERIGKTLWKFMHQNGETEVYTPLVQALTSRLTPIQLARVVTCYPAASPMPETMVRSLRRHLASNPVTRVGIMGGGIGVDWKILHPGHASHPLLPSLTWTYEQWKKRSSEEKWLHPVEIDQFVEASRKNCRQVAGFFMERLSVEQEPLDTQRAWNWRVAGAIIRRWMPETIAELTRLSITESQAEPDPLVLATRLAQGRACRHALEVASPKVGMQWSILYAGELITQWYQSSPQANGNRELRWVKFHEMHLLRKALRENGTAVAREWTARMQAVMEETFYGNDWQESRLAAICFEQNGEKPGRMSSHGQRELLRMGQSPNIPQEPERKPSSDGISHNGMHQDVNRVERPVSGPPGETRYRPTFFR